jgi:methionyl-tRNA formyltransferase
MFSIGRRAIGPDDTSVEVERDLSHLGAELLLDTVESLARGDAVETPQPAEGVTYAAKLAKAESAVAWTDPAARIHNLVRGLQPWPLVAARIGDLRVLLHKTQLTTETSGLPGGTVIRADAGGLWVVGGDGAVLRIVELQPEGRRAMSVRDFLAGRRIGPGTVIQPA